VPQTPLRGWGLAAALALAWGIGPALPALLRGELIGQPYTDLYPAVWGLWELARQQPGLPTHTEMLGHPSGIGYYYAAPLKGILAGGLLPLLGLPATWNLLTLAARVATPLCAFGAGRAWGLGTTGALTVAAAWGCAPLFHGYAVEGIVEGTDGWTLALWAWAAGHRRHGLSAIGLALSILSSWYLGAAGCLLALLSALRDRRALLGLVGGLALAAPGIFLFLGAFPSAEPLPDAIRQMMGAPLRVPSPGLSAGLNPFAITAYLGWALGAAAVLAAARGEHRLVALALIPAILSLGTGPWYDLPVLEMLRFPYRWHLATLALLGLAVGRLADGRGWWWLPLVVVAEGLLLSPVEPILPGAPADVPAIYARVDGPLLEVPGPVVRPPGVVNGSRPRARYLLYAQTRHGQPSPWAPDFNGLGAAESTPHLDPFRAYDRLEVAEDWEAQAGLTAADLAALRSRGIGLVMIQTRELGSKRARALRAALRSLGAAEIADDGDRLLLRLPAGD